MINENGEWIMHESEGKFMNRIEALCESIDFPESVNHNYSVAPWTYSKLCITNFTERHKFWILITHLKEIRCFMRDKTWGEDAITGALIRVILFCLAWIYSIYDWEKDRCEFEKKG